MGIHRGGQIIAGLPVAALPGNISFSMFITPFSQVMESLVNSGRFILSLAQKHDLISLTTSNDFTIEGKYVS